MSEQSAENTPLKLYKQAYVLHYKEQKIAEACDLYEQLIKEFPGSDVSAYASIQLHKIHADDATRALARRSLPTLPIIIALGANIVVLIIICIFFAVQMNRINIEREKYSALSRALGKMYTGNDNDALDILRELKISFRNDITPFALSSEIYRKNRDYLRARKEYETYRRLYPDDPIPEMEIALINEEEDTHIKKKMSEKNEEKPPIPEEVVKEEEKEAQKRAAARAAKRKRIKRRYPPKKKRPKLLVPADSISYF